MQLTIDQYNELYGTDLKEVKPIEFTEYIAYLMKQVQLESNNEDILCDIKKLV